MIFSPKNPKHHKKTFDFGGRKGNCEVIVESSSIKLPKEVGISILFNFKFMDMTKCNTSLSNQ